MAYVTYPRGAREFLLAITFVNMFLTQDDTRVLTRREPEVFVN